MAPKRRTTSIALPPFLSPLSKSKFEARQTRREYLGRLEWGTPVKAQRSADNLICRSGRELTSEEPPELDIGEALLSVPAHGTAEDDLEDKICVRMPGRPSPVSISGRDLNMTTNAGAMSPSSSPRLPSPPPFTEVQIGPKSPTIGASAMGTEHELGGVSKPDMGATRRIRPGTKAADMASGPPLVPLAELDSPFQLQEHLKALYYAHTKPSSSTHQVPITRETALILAQPPENVERSLWLYELCRFLTQRANNLIVAFFAESPPCSAQTCPEMRASEWQYLCAVHDPPKSCCAIDYCCHTLDWASSILTSQKHFPSRLTLGSESTGGTQQGVRQLTNIFRRVYRIFAHAWFQHRQVFWQVEGYDGLYIFFKTVCDYYALIPEDNYTIPPEAEGIVENAGSEQNPETEKDKSAGVGDDEHGHGQMTILKKEDESTNGEDADPTTTISTGATTRRHKHTPSTGSAVTTIVEGDEEEKEHKEEKKRESSPETETETPAAQEDEDEEDEDEGETEEEAETIPALTDEELAALMSRAGVHKDHKDGNNDNAIDDAEHQPSSEPASNPHPDDDPAANASTSTPADHSNLDSNPNAHIHTRPSPAEAAEKEHFEKPTDGPAHDEKGADTAAETKTSVSEEEAASAVEEGAEDCSLEKVEG